MPFKVIRSRSDIGRKRLAVGEMELTYARLELKGEPAPMVLVYTAIPGSRSAEGLSLLASWAATLERSAAIPVAAATTEQLSGGEIPAP